VSNQTKKEEGRIVFCLLTYYTYKTGGIFFLHLHLYVDDNEEENKREKFC